jgi:beta-glucanase (GH16 family)
MKATDVMKRTIHLFVLLASLIVPPALIAGTTWEPVWKDEFNGPNIDRNNWTYDIGGGGWGNNELQYYTDRSTNSRIEYGVEGDPSNGYLLIEARQERFRNRDYTSARLKTQGLRNLTYGRVEIRGHIPGGTGVWPAFWMLGANFTEVSWPDCGEIDLMEHVEREPDMGPNTVRSSLHGPEYFGANSFHGDVEVPGLTSEFHVYALEWEPTEIRWYVDGVRYLTATPATIPGTWVFDHPFFIIMNLAIGGNWPGPPDENTVFPVQMFVDYLRVYRDANLPPPPALTELHAAIAMSTAVNGPNWQAVATVTVTDPSGARVSGVTVTGAWSGLINVGVTERVTDANGVAVLQSGRVRGSGTIRFSVSNLQKTGYFYRAGSDCAEISR